MSQTNSVARSLHDVGLAAWFGGSLMGAIGLNGAAAQARDPKERARLSTFGWKRWSPVNAVAIGGHLLGGALIVRANRSRIGKQAGVAGWTGLKSVLTGAALVATAASGYYGKKMGEAEDSSVSGATESSAATSPEVASAQRALKPLQWAIPALTGAILVANARMGEQQRPSEVGSGVLRSLIS